MKRETLICQPTRQWHGKKSVTANDVDPINVMWKHQHHFAHYANAIGNFQFGS
jgi:hypothetical protein